MSTDQTQQGSSQQTTQSLPPVTEKPQVRIHYCNRCRWLMRSAWMAQELLTTFENELGGVSLQPNNDGHFSVWVNDICVWERKKDGGFPQPPELKQRIRDQVSPGKDLGHSDVKGRDVKNDDMK